MIHSGSAQLGSVILGRCCLWDQRERRFLVQLDDFDR